MSIELGPVACKEASPVESSKSTKSTEGDKANTTNGANGADTPPNGFLALLSQFAAPAVADTPVAVPLDTSTLKTKTDADPTTTDASLGDPSALSATALTPAAMDAASLIAQMQIGAAAQAATAVPVPATTRTATAATSAITGMSKKADTLGQATLLPETALTDAQSSASITTSATASPKHKTPSLATEGDAATSSTALTALAVNTEGAAGDGGGSKRGGKSGAGADKHTPSQHLQAALANQNAASRAERAEQSVGTPSPTMTMGETFRQLIEVAKSDKSTESGNAMGQANASDRSALTPSMALDFSAKAATVLNGNADVSNVAAGFGVEPPNANPVAMWVSQNVQSAEITLDAQGQDPVQVSIQMSGNEAQVQIRSDVPETRELLSQAVSTLDSALQREGLSLSGVSVGASFAGKDNSREPGQNGSQMGRLSGRLSRLSGGAMGSQAAGQLINVGASVQAALGRVDYFV